MNAARIQTFFDVAALSWRKMTLLAAIGVLLGFALAITIPLSVS